MNGNVEELYDKQVYCPVCNEKFSTKKLRRSAMRVQSTDADFCVHYKSENPYFYALWVCRKCGYVEFENRFESISKAGADKIKKEVTPKWTPRDYGGKRDIAQAMQIYKLALYQAELLQKEYSHKAVLCLMIAWLYRYENDTASETRFMKSALELYAKSYSAEDFPIGGMDSAKLSYLIGELNRRCGNFRESIKWFDKAINDPNVKKSIHIKKKAREQWHIAAEYYKAEKPAE